MIGNWLLGKLAAGQLVKICELQCAMCLVRDYKQSNKLDVHIEVSSMALNTEQIVGM